MYRIRADELPKVGMSHQFVGAERGDVGASAYLVNAPPGKGPPPHTHPYDKIAFIQAGRARWTVNGETFEAGAGEILVVKAGEVHNFTSVGPEPLVQLDVHLGARFQQTNV
jgi:quercetin dioxygenase-like cupin family protein